MNMDDLTLICISMDIVDFPRWMGKIAQLCEYRINTIIIGIILKLYAS